MAKTSINYLFPPAQIEKLPTWRFVLHFKSPSLFRDRKLREAVDGLKAADWKIIEFPLGLDNLPFDAKAGTVGVPIEVSEERRRRPNSLADYESDVWKVSGHMSECYSASVFCRISANARSGSRNKSAFSRALSDHTAVTFCCRHATRMACPK
jgi:hypothetical protein